MMKKTTKILLSVLGIGLLMLAVGLMTSRPTPAQAPTPAVPVLVQNTAARPVLTSAQGTTTVAGSVTAQQGGSWNVGVTNALNAGTPVPLIVGNVDEPGRIPYQSEALVNSCNGISCTYTFNNPSAGHRLVVQHISGSWNNTTFGATLVVGASADSGAARAAFDKTEPATSNQFFFDQPVLFYVDAGHTFTVSMGVNSGTSLGASIFVSGYLVDCGVSACAPIAQSSGTF